MTTHPILLVRACRNINEFVPIGINDQGMPAHGLAHGAIVVNMRMPVQQIIGMITVNKTKSDLKP